MSYLNQTHSYISQERHICRSAVVVELPSFLALKCNMAAWAAFLAASARVSHNKSCWTWISMFYCCNRKRDQMLFAWYSIEGWIPTTTPSMDWHVHDNFPRLQPYYPSVVGTKLWKQVSEVVVAIWVAKNIRYQSDRSNGQYGEYLCPRRWVKKTDEIQIQKVT